MKRSALSMENMQLAADQAVELLRALAHKDRLLLMCQLSQGEMTVGELEIACGIYQPSLSQHLGVLRRKALVETRREGKHQVYRVGNTIALAVMQVLCQHYSSESK